MKKPLMIGIGGGTGSGKTYFSKELKNTFMNQETLIISQDSYYRDQKGIPFKVRELVNYDHPDAFDHTRLKKDLQGLINLKEISLPVYDYKTHLRIGSKQIQPTLFIVVEGILALHYISINKLFDFKIYISTPEETRLERRISRDTKKRGRTKHSIIEQFNKSVKKMHNTYVAKTKKYADIIIAGPDDKIEAIKKIKTLLEQNNDTDT